MSLVLGKLYKNCLKFKKSVTLQTYFEVSSMNQKPFIWLQDKIKTNLDKNMREFGFRQSVRKLSETWGKVLFYKTFFNVSNINRELIIRSKHKIITKFGPKKSVSLVLGNMYENCSKFKENCYFVKLTSKWVISTLNSLFDLKIR